MFWFFNPNIQSQIGTKFETTLQGADVEIKEEAP